MTSGRIPLSAAFFCPQARAPDEPYLVGLHAFLRQHPHGQILLKHVSSLKSNKTWEIFASAREDVRSISHRGSKYIDLLHDWAVDGTSHELAKARSGIIALPLLTILQIGQYLRYLDHHRLSHQEFLKEVRIGGVQGYCGGLPSAVSIGCASDEAELVENVATALRILIGVGAYGEAVDEAYQTDQSTTLVVRLKHEGQGDELTQQFPGTHVSAVTEPRSVSIVGPPHIIDELYRFARDQQGLQLQKMDIQGKVHSPENLEIAQELSSLCLETPGLQLPDSSRLQVPVRSNKSGDTLFNTGSLTQEIITTILASRCEWFNLMSNVASDLSKSQQQGPHSLVVFGLTDCVPMAPFHKNGLATVKFQARTLIQPGVTSPDPSIDPSFIPTLPSNSIAVIGAACRLPGANNLSELWSLLASSASMHTELPTDRFDLPSSFRVTSQSPFAQSRKFYGNFIDTPLIKKFDHCFFGYSPREAASMDPQQRILLELSYEALDDAAYFSHSHGKNDNNNNNNNNNDQKTTEDDYNVGVFIGASFNEYLENTTAHGPTAFTATGTIRAFLCGRISYQYGWSGPSEVIDTACSASLVAVNRAVKAIQNGECPMALAGGVNIITGITNFLDLGKAGFLSPTGQCKPFDAAADGYCRSDGAGLVVLKKLEDALKAGDNILGVIPAASTNQGGKSKGITVPEKNAQQRLYRHVLQQSGLRKEDVTYVEAHGTGTQVGDPLEIESLRNVLGGSEREKELFVGSIKGNVGHSETAAGVAGLLKVLAMLRYGKIPGQASHQNLNPKLPKLQGMAIPRSLREWDAPVPSCSG